MQAIWLGLAVGQVLSLSGDCAYNICGGKRMNYLGITSGMNAVANAISSGLSVDEITLLASILVQIGDTLVTIATLKASCVEGDKNCAG